MKEILKAIKKHIYNLDEFLEIHQPTPEEAMIEYQSCVNQIRDIVETEIQFSNIDKGISRQLFTEATCK